jgi:hypothetical protein
MNQVPHTDCAENFSWFNPFHIEMSNLNHTQGSGEVIALVWNMSKEAPGVKTGIAVCQTEQFGLTTRRFTVNHTDTNYTLKFMGKTIKVESDYFEGELNG